MSRYSKDKKAFRDNPSPQTAGDLLASSMQASGKRDITDAELVEDIFAVRDFLYKASAPKDRLS